MTQEFYLTCLWFLQETVNKKRAEPVWEHSQFLQHDNALFFNMTMLLCAHANHPKVFTRKQNFIVF